MLLHLKIQDLIIIESLEISFGQGLNIFTGETGSGKSTIMEALGLVLGARADIQMIRGDANKAIIEAEFDISQCPFFDELLQIHQIEHDEGELLKIRRELCKNGKNRAFINYQLVQAQTLKDFGKYLVSIVSQHANQQLLETLSHRDFLDSYAGIKQKVKALTLCWEKKSHLQKQLLSLKENEAYRLREKDRCLMELEELSEANFKAEEEEELFKDYQRLSKSEELSHQLQSLLQCFQDGKTPVLNLINKQKNALSQLIAIDSFIEESYKTLDHICIELDEFVYGLRSYFHRIEHNPTKLIKINERLTQLHRIKKKYGINWQSYQESLYIKLDEIEKADENLKQWEEDLEQLNNEYLHLAREISEIRIKAASDFEREVLDHLRSLNMEKAQFKIAFHTCPEGPKGIDQVQFMLAPNLGESFFAVQDCASGGELARLMLSIKSVIANKEQYPTLVFDEIDANLGGETATIVGEKLHSIGLQRQVVCITHLPQVALKAHHHLKIFKEEKNDRTITQIKVLDPFSRQSEIARMFGGINVLKECNLQ